MRHLKETGPRLFTLSEQEPVALFAIGERHGRSVHPRWRNAHRRCNFAVSAKFYFAHTGVMPVARASPFRLSTRRLMSSQAVPAPAALNECDHVAPADPVRHLRPHGRHVPVRARPDRRRHRHPHDRRRPARPQPAGLGDHRLPDRLDDRDADLRQALRHLRPPPAVHLRDRHLHRRVDPRLASRPR